MKWNSIPPDYAAKAIAAKELARKNCSHENLHLMGGFLTAAAVAASILFFDPFFFEQSKRWIILPLVAVGIGAYYVLGRLLPLKASPAKCPNCLHDWTIREGRSVPLAEQMLRWDKCPGCGALMNDGLLQRALKQQPSNEVPDNLSS